MSKRSAVTGILILVSSAAVLACAGRAFERAKAEDTAAAYAHFVRQHPHSHYAQEARERSAIVRIRAHPSPEGYRDFLAKYPDSKLKAELRAVVEEAFFLRARGAATVDAYREFLKDFGNSSYADRARGNAAYLAADGFDGQPEALARFAAEHPASDFAAEAARSAKALEARAKSSFRRVGLEIRIARGTPGADRLVRVFTERAQAAYQAAGLQLVRVDSRASVPVRLTISHSEREVRTQLQGTEVTSPGIRATTQLQLTRNGEPIWSEAFDFHAPVGARREGTSILFGAGTETYWTDFFVPVTHWSTKLAVRPPRGFSDPVVAVDATSTHAYALFGDGHFQIFELSDPQEPLLVGEYRRPRDLAQWGGLRVTRDRVLLFGEDGIEAVRLSPEGPQRVAVWERGTVGSIVAVEPARGGIVAAGKRGLLFLAANGAAPEQLLDRPVLGLASLGDRLVFTDGTSLYVSTLRLLRQKRVEGELRLGTGFGPERVHVRGRTAIVLGNRGVVRVSLARPSAPRLMSRIDTSEVGAVSDATLVRGRLFLLGHRGLQIADARGEHVVDMAPVAAEARLDASGRHVVMVGEKALQVVDTTPFVLVGAGSPPARLETDPDG